MTDYTTTQIYAHYLATQLTFYVGMREGLKPNAELPKGWEELGKEHYEMVRQLKASGNFDTGKGRTVFADFKELRDKFVPEGLGIMEKISRGITSAMTKDELLAAATKIIEGWQSNSGTEIKRG